MFTRSLSRKLSTLSIVNDTKITNSLAEKLFVLKLNPENATVSYDKNNNIYTLIESYVPESYRGLGIGKILAKKTFDYIVSENAKMKLECEFLQKVYSENPNPYKKYIVS